ncbi:valine--tRNA ligase [candidate division WWE3 bacterium CG06_land_8_20_14_3_00_42_16]|uniref:Valine--tRNA ligase n=1 Tax=candidate division WWE3 bacterium CG06_land_8_20_14_3_00_42_16 TaxID=1975083 RepID=A0A2M7AME8_UNCKA|nr:MAG: valine--tRNA ligase [candidate division WWE3 bacterium CG06_land_8_20_14_3_00_42_16]
MSKSNNYQPYNSNEAEPEIYKLWEKSGQFTPKIDPKKKPFSIIMPPPNANGSLHIGHAMFVTLEDILIRYHRMLGEAALWLPGADHAGILTQVVYEKKIKKERGANRKSLGREKFYAETLSFTLKNKKVMENQLRALGASCDWTREKFTLDPNLTPAIYLTFKKLYEAGFVYRGQHLINWCPRCETAISDLEVSYQQEKTKLTFIKYPLKNSAQFILVATTRPETMLGDTAVAVNPKDKRYSALVGKIAILPLVNREIPIIADEAVDPAFGSGAVKVTPAHDPVDFEIGMRHQLPIVSVIGPDNKMTQDAPVSYQGLMVKLAREKVVAALVDLNLLTKQKDYQHRVGHCERCKTTIEPLISWQWFIHTEPLAAPVVELVEKEQVKILPKRFTKTFLTWMKNLKDWCISRQIWWGITIPVFYCEDCQKIMLAVDDQGNLMLPQTCAGCGSVHLRQETDTFDTWFSSGQWPYITLGWPQNSADYQYFYPTSVLETGYEILNIWVARMLMLGIFATGVAPFKTVYLHGMVRDAFGQKMSKSRPETAIDPLSAIAKFGADALRLALTVGSAAGNDVSISGDKIRGYRNFANKVWNAARFTKGHLLAQHQIPEKVKAQSLTADDKKMFSELKKLLASVNKDFEHFRLGRLGEKLYDSFWHVFCDWYLEAAKKRLFSQDEKDKEICCFVLKKSLMVYLKLLHPLAPFVTEKIWQSLKTEEQLLISASWPDKIE